MSVTKPYDPAARCPKCGNDHVGTYYRATGFSLMGSDRTAMGIDRDDKDFLTRTCQRCCYSWAEKTINLTLIPPEPPAPLVAKYPIGSRVRNLHGVAVHEVTGFTVAYFLNGETHTVAECWLEPVPEREGEG